MRRDGKALFASSQLIRSYTLEHRQVYRFEVHKAKLDMLERDTGIRGIEHLPTYFDTVGPNYPHHLFTTAVERSSKFPADFRPRITTKEDVEYYRTHGFTLNIDAEVITGHIDFLQIRNGYIHILDYKPEARKEKHAHVQLTIYALALARRTNLPLKIFKCAWFDEKDYFEFFPLTGVYPRRISSF